MTSPSPAPAVSLFGAAINVVNLDREIAFYTQALGMRVAMTLPMGARSETILTFGSDPGQASLLLMHNSSPAAPKKIEHGNNFSRLVIRVSDLDALGRRLDALGHEHSAIRDAGHGYRLMFLTDPEGFRIELVQQGS